jgi:hypothetical protein
VPLGLVAMMGVARTGAGFEVKGEGTERSESESKKRIESVYRGSVDAMNGLRWLKAGLFDVVKRNSIGCNLRL